MTCVCKLGFEFNTNKIRFFFLEIIIWNTWEKWPDLWLQITFSPPFLSFLLLHFLHLSCLLNPHSFFFMLTVWPLVQILLNTSYLAFTLSFRGFPGGPVVKNTSASIGDAGDAGSIPGSGRCSGGGHGNPLQYSCLGKPMDRGAWWAMVYVVAKSWTRLSDWALNLSFRNNYNSEWNILILPLYS